MHFNIKTNWIGFELQYLYSNVIKPTCVLAGAFLLFSALASSASPRQTWRSGRLWLPCYLTHWGSALLLRWDLAAHLLLGPPGADRALWPNNKRKMRTRGEYLQSKPACSYGKLNMKYGFANLCRERHLDSSFQNVVCSDLNGTGQLQVLNNKVGGHLREHLLNLMGLLNQKHIILVFC